MKNIVLILISMLITSCMSAKKKQIIEWGDKSKNPGHVSMAQVTTTANETYINVLRGRYANYEYYAVKIDPENPEAKTPVIPAKITKTTRPKRIHWAVDQVHITNLEPNVDYNFIVKNKRFNREVDRRVFSTMDLSKKKAKFAVASCLSDSHRFEHVRDAIWNQVMEKDPDFLLITGDMVYVDDFDFVKRKKAKEFDIWTRYIDSINKIPLFKNRRLIPILATWDDHDYGSNNQDRSFKGKWAALKVFNSFFRSPNIKGVFTRGKGGVYAKFEGFGQKFFLLDNRFFRAKKDSKNKFAHYGERQHNWLLRGLKENNKPSWLVSGGQFFSTRNILKSGKQINESFMEDHKFHHQKLMNDLRNSPSPVAFLSGDVHFSETMEVEEDFLGYRTYEITSSPIHSYIFRANENQDEFFPNKRRLNVVKDYNFILVNSDAYGNQWNFTASSFGPKQRDPYFENRFSVNKKASVEAKKP